MSINSTHQVTEMWRDDKRIGESRGIQCDKRCLVDGQDEREKVIVQYVFECLNALGVRHGPGHTEVIWTNDGPVAIDIASRLQGSVDIAAVEAAQGKSQVSCVVTSVMNRHGHLPNPVSGDEKSHLMAVYLINEKVGRVRALCNVDRLTSLNSFFSVRGLPQIGDLLGCTRDLDTTYGIVFLVSQCKNQLLDDYSTIRCIEAEKGFFELEESRLRYRKSTAGDTKFPKIQIG